MLELECNLDIEKISRMSNVAEHLCDEDLHLIAEYLKQQITIDKQSRAQWEALTKEVIAMATMEKEEKNTPWEGASNVKAPLTAIAVYQFAARALPEIVKNGKVVNVAVIGFDPDGSKSAQARRVGMHMNYQLLEESNTWEQSLDKLLHTLPLIGVAFKKVYYDPTTGENVSELVPYDKLYINANITSLEEAPRVTHQLQLSKNKILERIRGEYYRAIDEEQLDNAPLGAEATKEHSVLECHCTLDLDGDGYEEPYIVVFLEDMSEILRIYSRFDSDDVHFTKSGDVEYIEPIQYFIDYHCLPNPDGSYYSLGVGHLLYSINDSINSIQNQLIDSGTLANSQTGIAGRGFRLKGGDLKLKMGSIKVLDTQMAGPIKDSIHMMEFKEPSQVLLKLLGMLEANGKEVASINNATMGNEQVQNVASSVASSQIEQGTKVFTGIQRRVFMGLKKEFEAWFRLNSIFLDPNEYYQFVGGNQQISQSDYDEENLKIKPIADPTMSSEAIRMARAEALLKLTEDPVLGSIMNKMSVVMNFLDVLQIPNAEQMVVVPKPDDPPPLEVLKFQSETDAKAKQLQIDAHNANTKGLQTLISAKKADHETRNTDSDTTLNLAKAKAALDKTKLDKYATDLKAGTEVHKQIMGLHKTHLEASQAPVSGAEGGSQKPPGALPPPASIGDMVADALSAQPPMQAEQGPADLQQPQQTGSKPPGPQQ